MRWKVAGPCWELGKWGDMDRFKTCFGDRIWGGGNGRMKMGKRMHHLLGRESLWEDTVGLGMKVETKRSFQHHEFEMPVTF